jgi:hypothetical protein
VTGGRATAGPWVSAHLFHHGDLDALAAAVVAPAVHDLTATGLVTGAFFLRYWEGGPHLRLRLRAADPAACRRIRAEVRERAAGYFAEHPTAAAVTRDGYRAFAAAMARGERRERHDDRLRESDAVEFIPYEPELSAFGDAACVEAVERHFTTSSDLALAVVAAGEPMPRRAAVALACLTATLAVSAPDLEDAAARLTADLPAHARLTPEEEARYAARREELRHQARALWRQACATATGTTLTAVWTRSVLSLRDRLAALHDDGRCAPLDPGSPHGWLAAALPETSRTVPTVLLRCAHLFHNRLGLRADAEFATSRLLARSLADLAPRS